MVIDRSLKTTMAIYLDSNATTQVHPEVISAMLPFLRDHWHNPSSGYGAGQAVKTALSRAREQVAALLGAKPQEIVFTGCGTESNNMALKSLARQIGRKNSRVIVSQIEHSAVLRSTEAMAEVGYQVERIGVDGDGRLDLTALEKMIDASVPGLLSLMWANNETGVIQPMAEAVAMAQKAGWFVHSDAIQAVGKVPVRVDEIPLDLLAISGHKFHAPKGVGVLFIRENHPFVPMIRGGGQENNRRSGTENVPYIVGLGRAAEIMKLEIETGGLDRVGELRDRLETRLCQDLEGVLLNGSRQHRTTNVAHVSFEGCLASDMLPRLDAEGVQCSAGSACMTGKSRPSHVQKAMGFSDDRAFSSLRLSLSIFSTREEVDTAAEKIISVVKSLRRR